MDAPQDAAAKVRNDGRFTKGNPHRFKTGNDPKRWTKGRPKSFDQFRRLAQRVLAEELILPNGQKITVAEAMLRKCAKSNDAPLIRTLFEYGFGKVPDKIETTGLENKTTLILHFNHADENVTRTPPEVSLGTE